MGQVTKRFAMARAGRVAWRGQEDLALLTGDCSPASSDQRGAPLRGVSFPSARRSCPARLADGGVTDGADGGCRWGDADGTGGRDADWEMRMGGTGEGADGADGGMQMGTDADGADAGSPCLRLRRRAGDGGAAA